MSSSMPIFTTLESARAALAPYAQLSVVLKQQFPSGSKWNGLLMRHCVESGFTYRQLPAWLRSAVTEKLYAEELIRDGIHSQQLYPYASIQSIVRFTGKTPLAFYRELLEELLKKEKGYDKVPNFTAADILKLLGVGRNQFLELRKVALKKSALPIPSIFSRSSAHIREKLPLTLLPEVCVDPFAQLLVATQDAEIVSKQMPNPDHVLAFRSISRALAPRSNRSPALSPAPAPAPAAPATSSTVSSSSSLPGSTAGDSLTTQQHAPVSAPESNVSSGSPTAVCLSVTTASQGSASGAVAAGVYACEFDMDAVNSLHRHGFIVPMVTVDEDEMFVVDQFENFVMNCSSDDGLEALLYKVLVTLDDHTPLSLLSGMLNVELTTLCNAVAILVRLGLVHSKSGTPKRSRWPTELLGDRGRIHPSWREVIASDAKSCTTATSASSETSVLAGTIGQQHKPGEESPTASGSVTPTDSSFAAPVKHSDSLALEAAELSELDASKGTDEGHPTKRVALLYSTAVTGFLMMANVRAQGSNRSSTALKNHAVTLFEAGKMSHSQVDQLLDCLDALPMNDLAPDASPQPTLVAAQQGKEDAGGELAAAGRRGSVGVSSMSTDTSNYYHHIQCIKEILRSLQHLSIPHTAPGVDLIKIDALNDLDANARYTILCRNYNTLFVVSPTDPPPLLDESLPGVYGSCVSLCSSPWLLLYLYSKLAAGPPCVLLPAGYRMKTLPNVFSSREISSGVAGGRGGKQSHRDRHIRSGAQKLFVPPEGHTVVVESLGDDMRVETFRQTNALIPVNDMLLNSAVFIRQPFLTRPLPLPFYASSSSSPSSTAATKQAAGGVRSPSAVTPVAVAAGRVRSPVVHSSFSATALVPLASQRAEVVLFLLDDMRRALTLVQQQQSAKPSTSSRQGQGLQDDTTPERQMPPTNDSKESSPQAMLLRKLQHYIDLLSSDLTAVDEPTSEDSSSSTDGENEKEEEGETKEGGSSLDGERSTAKEGEETAARESTAVFADNNHDEEYEDEDDAEVPALKEVFAWVPSLQDVTQLVQRAVNVLGVHRSLGHFGVRLEVSVLLERAAAKVSTGSSNRQGVAAEEKEERGPLVSLGLRSYLISEVQFGIPVDNVVICRRILRQLTGSGQSSSCAAGHSTKNASTKGKGQRSAQCGRPRVLRDEDTMLTHTRKMKELGEALAEFVYQWCGTTVAESMSSLYPSGSEFSCLGAYPGGPGGSSGSPRRQGSPLGGTMSSPVVQSPSLICSKGKMSSSMLHCRLRQRRHIPSPAQPLVFNGTALSFFEEREQLTTQPSMTSHVASSTTFE